MPSDRAALSPVDRFFEFSLLGLLTSGYLAVVGSGFLDAPTIFLTASAILIRALSAAGLIRYRIPPPALAAATLGYMGFYPLDYAFISRSFLPATVHLVFFLAVVKILTASTNRDYLLLKLIAFLELLAACTLSSRFNFFLFLALFLVLGVATFMSSEVRIAAQKDGEPVPGAGGIGWRLSGISVSVSAGILILTAALFFLLPRTARAALQHFLPHRYDEIAGFSNEVSLGEIGEIKKRDTPVMHIKMSGNADRPPALHWRGSALSQFDGHRWFNPAIPRGELLRPDPSGQLWLGPWRRARWLSYEVHLNEPPADGVLFFAGSPQSLRLESPAAVLHTPADAYRVVGGYGAVNYKAFSYLDPSSSGPPGLLADPQPVPLSSEAREIYLQLPPLDARIWTLARRATDGQPTLEAKARALESYLQTNFGYTLEQPEVEPAEPLANFLFRRKKGHCEYFASAMAVMLRTIGIPSRVVIGFAGGIYNPISGWHVVRASDAHAWVEAWLPRMGWVTFDPTPADPNVAQISVWTRLGFYLDAAEVFWQDWVLNYNLNRQLVLAGRMQASGRNFRTNWMDDWSNSSSEVARLATLFGPLVVSLGVFSIAVYRFGPRALDWWRKKLRLRQVRRGDIHRSDATLLYERMLGLLKRRGIEKPPWLTPSEFARMVQDPGMGLLVEDITTAYNELRFGGRPEAAPRMIRLLSELEACPE